MSFNPFSGFPTALTALPHFAVGKFQQSQDAGFVLPSQGLQIAVSTVDTSQLNSNFNGNFHVSSPNTLQIQNQMLNTLLGKGAQNDASVKAETDGEDSDHYQQQQQQLLEEKNSLQQDLNNLNEYLARFSGPPTFPFQPMYKYPADLIQIANQANTQQQQQQSLNGAGPSQMPQSQDQQPQQSQPQAEAPKKSKKKKKKREPLPGAQAPRRRSTSLQPALTTGIDGSTLYGCPQCHIVFSSRDAIETHIAIHRSERPFICTDCGAALKRKEHLDRHRSSHMTERPHPCPVCNKTFKRVEHLQRHSIIHRTDKVHRCNECGKGFNRKDHLTKHIHSHLSKKIKQELGQQATKASLQVQQQQPMADASSISLQAQSILAQLQA